MEKKKDYEHAQLELVYFNDGDVIATSRQFGDSGFDYSGWSKSEDEWS